MNKLLLLSRSIFLALLLIFAFSCKDPIPHIIFTAPQEGDEYFKNIDIEVKVIITDIKGKAVTVQLYVDDILFDELSNTPYYFTIKAGTLLPGEHTIKVTTNGVEALRTIKVNDAASESPDFVTFTNGIIPPEWSVKNWKISTSDGVDDHFSLSTITFEAQATTSKKCNKISFYLKGLGAVNLYMDGKFWENIQLNAGNLQNPIPQEWTFYEYSCPIAYHTFTWEYVAGFSFAGSSFAGIDAIRFKIEN